MLARDKVLSKKLFSFHRIPFPDFMVVPQGRTVKRPKWLPFPLIVKSVTEEASLGISQASIVQDDDKLKERVDSSMRVWGPAPSLNGTSKGANSMSE